MARIIAGIVGGLVAWFVVATVLNFPLRWWWSGYAEAEPTMTFALPMQVARLAVGALASLAAGFVCTAIARRAGRGPYVLGILLVALFIPVHYGLWDKFPLWYHAVFLISLAPLVVVGAFLARRAR
jgi:hypothetical protein